VTLEQKHSEVTIRVWRMAGVSSEPMISAGGLEAKLPTSGTHPLPGPTVDL